MTNDEVEQSTEQILTAGVTAQVKIALDLDDILESFLGGPYSELAADVIEGLTRMGAM